MRGEVGDGVLFGLSKVFSEVKPRTLCYPYVDAGCGAVPMGLF